jgi:hypothetical protein
VTSIWRCIINVLVNCVRNVAYVSGITEGDGAKFGG